jgi:hypothetical protein
MFRMLTKLTNLFNYVKTQGDFPFTRLKNIISPYDLNELTKITLNNQEFSISRLFNILSYKANGSVVA